MARFRKTILTCGTHESPEGQVVVTPERLKKFANTHKAMRSAEINHPVCWGHHLSSVPQYPADLQFDAQQYLGSAFNCGKFTELIVDGENLDAIIDVPGADVDEQGNLRTWVKDPETNKLLPAAISEVSPAIVDRFEDGRGRVWEDIIGHVALVPYPVQMGQTGFKQLSALPNAKVTFLSTKATGWKLLGAGSRAGKFGDDEADETADLEDEPTETPEEPEVPEEPADDAGSEYAKVAAIVDKLAEVAGIHLPGATTKDDLIEHLSIILDHMQQAGAKPMGGEEEEAAAGAGGPVVAEQAPMMMSVFRDDTILAHIRQKHGADAEKIIAAGQSLSQQAPRLSNVNTKLLVAETDRRKRVQAKLLERVAKYVPPEILTELDIKPETMMLSATRAGDIIEPRAFSATELLRILLATVKSLPNAKLTRTMSAAIEHPNPLRQAKSGDVSDEEAKEMAERIAHRKFSDKTPKPSRNGHSRDKRRPAR
jgi:hypothetical protein